MLTRGGPNPFHIDWSWARNEATIQDNETFNSYNYDLYNSHFNDLVTPEDSSDDIRSMHYPHLREHVSLKQALAEQKATIASIERAHKDHKEIEKDFFKI